MRGVAPLCYNIVVALSTLSFKQMRLVVKEREHEHNVDLKYERKRLHIHP